MHTFRSLITLIAMSELSNWCLYHIYVYTMAQQKSDDIYLLMYIVFWFYTDIFLHLQRVPHKRHLLQYYNEKRQDKKNTVLQYIFILIFNQNLIDRNNKIKTFFSS